MYAASSHYKNHKSLCSPSVVHQLSDTPVFSLLPNLQILYIYPLWHRRSSCVFAPIVKTRPQLIEDSTGATGYIGGDILHALYHKHPEWEYAALVRSEEKAQPVKAAFPNVHIIIGDIEDAKLLEAKAAKADIVIRTYSPFPSHQAASRIHMVHTY